MTMQTADILHRRLCLQYLGEEKLSEPTEVVRRLGAVQAQDFDGAAWGVGQRTTMPKRSEFTAAFSKGEILRTHVMRPTWHFVASEDIGWLQDLTWDRLRRSLGYYFKRLELDPEILRRACDIIQKALEGGNHLTRTEVSERLTAEKIDVHDGVRLAHILIYAEGESIICSGIPKGKQQTYALLSERALHLRRLTREEALAELTQRYFTSHGPAAVADYAWWAGLTKTEAMAAVASVEQTLEHWQLGDTTYWFADTGPVLPPDSSAHLLPNYDEYVVAYANRDFLFNPNDAEFLDSRQNPLFNHVLILDGMICGTWRKTERRNSITIDVTVFRQLSATEKTLVRRAAERYGVYRGVAELILQGV